MKKAIVFDFGAVLIDWSPYHLYRKLLPSDESIREFLEEIKFSEFNPILDTGYPFQNGSGIDRKIPASARAGAGVL
jgi:2-haloacid dehalogenase